MNDPVIERSPLQRAARVEQMHAELLTMGFSVISTARLQELLSRPVQIVRVRRPVKQVEYSEQAAG
jgi:hypothetical protein